MDRSMDIAGVSSRYQMPASVLPYCESPAYNSETLPKGASTAQRNGKDVWSELVVDQGACDLFWLDDSGKIIHLESGDRTVIPPKLIHKIRMQSADATIHFSFYRSQQKEAETWKAPDVEFLDLRGLPLALRPSIILESFSHLESGCPLVFSCEFDVRPLLKNMIERHGYTFMWLFQACERDRWTVFLRKRENKAYPPRMPEILAADHERLEKLWAMLRTSPSNTVFFHDFIWGLKRHMWMEENRFLAEWADALPNREQVDLIREEHQRMRALIDDLCPEDLQSEDVFDHVAEKMETHHRNEEHWFYQWLEDENVNAWYANGDAFEMDSGTRESSH